MTPSQRNALANYSRGIKPEYEYTTGVFFILNEDIPNGFLKDKDYLDAQYIAVGKNSEEEDLNTRGLGGKKMLKAAANRMLGKNVITRITDGTHMEVIDGVKVLKPNIEYEKFGATYRTNANRDITYANAVITKITPDNIRNPKAQRDIVEQTGIEGDHGGHLIARILGGSGDIDNLVSMSAWTNTSAYRIMENAVKKHVMAGRTVEITIVPNRSNSRRPDSFDVEYTVIETGEFNQMRIPNSKV